VTFSCLVVDDEKLTIRRSVDGIDEPDELVSIDLQFELSFCVDEFVTREI